LHYFENEAYIGDPACIKTSDLDPLAFLWDLAWIRSFTVYTEKNALELLLFSLLFCKFFLTTKLYRLLRNCILCGKIFSEQPRVFLGWYVITFYHIPKEKMVARQHWLHATKACNVLSLMMSMRSAVATWKIKSYIF